MDKDIQILVVCVHEGIRATIVRLLTSHSPQWHITAAESAARALVLGNITNFDVVLLGNGLTETEEQELTHNFSAQLHSVKIIRHFGGGSGLLFGEIYQALEG